MDIPGVTDTTDPEVLDRAEEQAQDVLAALKEQVRTTARDIGTLRKELSVTVPATFIAERLQKDFGDLRGDAQLPGFRKGRAPMSLLRRKFGGEVLKTLKTTIVGQSYFAAIEKEKLTVLGDPLFRVESGDGVKLAEFNEALPKLKFSESEDFAYSCEIEIKPTFELPELKGIAIKRPKIEVAEKDVDAFIERQQKIRGHYDVVADRGAEGDDLLIADVKLTVDGQMIKEEANVQLGVRATRLDGVALMDLGEKLKGARPGEERETESVIPDDYERADLRGKTGKFTFKINELKQLNLAEISLLVEQFGCKDEADFRDAVRQELELESNRVVNGVMRDQVCDYLLKNTTLDIPENLSARQTDRAVARRVIELQQSGVPMGDIETRIDELRTSARNDVARGLKLEFVLDKVAEQLKVRVGDEELNSEIARMARMYRQRFDRVRDDLHSRGLLGHLADQIRLDKSVGVLLSQALIEDVAEKS